MRTLVTSLHGRLGQSVHRIASHHCTNWVGMVRCAFFDRNLLSRKPLVPTPARLKLLHACDQWHSSRVFTPLTGCHCKLRANTEGEQISAHTEADKGTDTPHGPRRWLFNLTHRTTGWILFGLALVQCSGFETVLCVRRCFWIPCGSCAWLQANRCAIQ